MSSQLLRQLLRPGPFAAITGSLMLCLLLLTMTKVTDLIPSYRQFSMQSQVDVSAKLASQLRPDQGSLESVGHHLFSAYFDTRSTLDGRKYVRIIAVLDTKAYEGDLICQFAHESGRLSFSASARKSAIGAGMPHRLHFYKEFVLSCPIANDTSLAAFVFVQTGDASLRSQVLRVRHNPLSLGRSPATQQSIINCVSVTYGSPSEFRLIEWLEAQRLLKMSKVELHFYKVTNRKFETVAKAYSAEGFLNLKQIHCPFCEPGNELLHLLLMSPTINQCFYENLGGYTYTAVFDLDEIIVPQQHPDYATLLAFLEQRISANSFAFNNWYHFSELGEDASVDARMYMLRHPYKTREVTPVGYSTKSIHRSCCVMALHNHFSWEDVPRPNTRILQYFVETPFGLNEHYKACHLDQYECHRLTRREDRQLGSRLTQLIGDELTAAFHAKIKQILVAKAN